MQGQPKLEIRIRDHSQTRFDANNPMEVFESENKLPLKIAFFKVSIIASVCVKFQYIDIRDSVLESEHTPGLVLTIRV